MEPRRVAIMLDLVWPYKRHSDVFAGIQRHAVANGWHSIIDEFVHHTLRKRRGAARPYDGIIARATIPVATHAARLGIPLVNVWPSSPARRSCPGVFPDGTEIGRLCVEHLMSRGFRTFATLNANQNQTEVAVVEQFERAAARHGFPNAAARMPQKPERDLSHWRKTERVIARWMNTWTPPVGVYIGQETIGRLVVQLCHDRGWRVPSDVAIIAGQNQETLCELPRPSLTSIELGYERIGYVAAKLLDGLMGGEKPSTNAILLPPEGIVMRESTDFFAVDDKVVAAALAFISANSHRPIGRTDVSRAVGVETRTLQNYFRKALNRPIVAEIRRVRVERAKRELTQSRRPLAQIARDVGFGNIQRLYEVFLREVGTTPGRYRKQRKLDGQA